MMNNLENIDQLFREGLYDYAPQPPAGGWERLQGELTKSREIKLIPMWVRIAASILLISGAATLGWRYFSNSNSETQATIAEQPTVTKESTPVSIGTTPEIRKEELAITGTAAREPAQQAVTEKSSPEKTAIPSAEYAELPENTLPVEEIRKETPVEEQTEELIPPQELKDPQLADEVPEEEIKPSQVAPSKINVNELIMQNNLLALEESDAEKTKASWSVGGTAGPQYTYRDVTVNSMPYQIDDFDEYESGVTTYAGGFQVEVEPARRFSIQSGVYYSKIGQVKTSIQIDNQFAGIHETWIQNPNDYVEPPRRNQTLPADLVNSTGKITFDNSLPPPINSSGDNAEWVPGTYTAEQYFEFIEVPLIVRYRIIDRKFNVNISSGIWANFLVGNKATATDNEDFTTEGRTDDINTFNYCGSLSLGFGYPLSSRLALSLEPFFKYYLSPINSNPQTEVYPYSMGIMTGVKYLF